MRVLLNLMIPEIADTVLIQVHGTDTFNKIVHIGIHENYQIHARCYDVMFCIQLLPWTFYICELLSLHMVARVES